MASSAPTRASCERTVVHRDPYKLPPNTTNAQCSYRAVGTFIGKKLCKLHFRKETEGHVNAQYNALNRRINDLRARDASAEDIEAAFRTRDAFDVTAALAHAQRGLWAN